MKTEMLIWLFPVVFMIHELEEITFVRWWIARNREELARRFPRLSKRLLPRLNDVSTASFTFIVAEEYILVLFLTFGSYWFANYALFISVVIAYGIHLAFHVLQFVIYRRYIPAIVTSVVTGVYTVFTIRHFYLHGLMQMPDVIIYTLASLLVLMLNLALLHRIAGKLNL